jgi:endonuclease YncB( thermonuclease family)
MKNCAQVFVVLAAGLVCAIGGAHADDISGIPQIIDGDTVSINGVRVRLQGIDAPETEQFCLSDKSLPAECGKGVRDRLREKSAGRPWTCKVMGQDTYKRSLARCYVGGEDIQKWMVRSGLAMAYRQFSHDYDSDEEAARSARAGLWSGAFIAPWDWRHRNASTVVLGAVSVPIGSQKVLLRSEAPAPTPTVAIPKTSSGAVITTHLKARTGCGSRGGPGYRLANGKCASRHKKR